MSSSSRALVALCVALVACSSDPAPVSNPSAPSPSTTTTGPSPEAGAADASASAAEAGTDAAIGIAPVESRSVEKLSSGCVAGPTGVGAYGAITQYDRYEIANPAWAAGGETPLPAVVFAPRGGAATHPVVLFSHPFGGNDWRRMLGIFELLVSHDDVVVFTPYPTKAVSVCQRYDILWGGFQKAIDETRIVTGMDTTRMGFAGHSFGGGATPWIAHEAITKRGWGTAGSFLFASAPWYVYRMPQAAWGDFPASMRLTTMVYADDSVNDHRMAIEDVWAPFPGPKSYLMLVSDQRPGCKLVADHGAPMCSSVFDTFDSLDSWGVLRQLRAVEACTLRGDASACAVADGTAADATSMGNWTASGLPVAPAQRLASPTAAHAQDGYVFKKDQEGAFPCSGAGGG